MCVCVFVCEVNIYVLCIYVYICKYICIIHIHTYM